MIKTSIEIAKEIAKCIDDKKGQDIQILDIGSISGFADYFVIAHGTSTRQVKAIVDEIEEKLEEQDIFIDHKEGYTNGQWVLMDYNGVVVHIFMEEERSFYNIERLWKDAVNVSIDNE